MSVELKAQITKSVPNEGVYRVAVDIIDAVNIDFDVLVFDVETDTFQHVATVYDLETWFADKGQAILATHAFYRGRGAVVHYAALNEATHFVSVTEERLQLLVTHWQTVTESFEGTSIVTVTSNPED